MYYKIVISYREKVSLNILGQWENRIKVSGVRSVAVGLSTGERGLLWLEEFS